MAQEALQSWHCVPLLRCCPSSAPPASRFPGHAQVGCGSCEVSPPCRVRSLAWQDALLCQAAALPPLRVAPAPEPRAVSVLLKQARSPAPAPRLSLAPAGPPFPRQENSIVLNRTMLHCLSIHQMQEVSCFCLFPVCFWALHELFIENLVVVVYFFQ